MKKFLVACMAIGSLGYVATNWTIPAKAAPEQLQETKEKARGIATDLAKKTTALADNPATAKPADWKVVTEEAAELQNVGQELDDNISSCRAFQSELTRKAETAMKALADRNGDRILRQEVKHRWTQSNSALSHQIRVAESVRTLIVEAQDSAEVLKLAGEVMEAAEAADRSAAELGEQSDRVRLAASRFQGITTAIAQKIAEEREGEVAGS